jgi:creatinine amidohydrolase/Fe(II)-dependent formamide hydrolase-like protein
MWAGQIAERLGNALVYPVVPFSMAGDPIEKTGHMRLPGTISLPSEVFLGVIRGVALSAISAGFKNVYVLGDHGGGQSELRLAAETLDADWRGKGVHVYYISNSGRRTEGERVSGRAEDCARRSCRRRRERAGHVPRSTEVDAEGQVLGGGRGSRERDRHQRRPALATAEMGKAFLDIKAMDAVEQIRKVTTATK